MKSRRITAIFRGQDGSLGYELDKEYMLDMYEDKGKLTIKRVDSNGYCEYTSFFTFLNNWSNISDVKR